MEKTIIPLEKEFIGKGEVKNINFLQLYSNENAYLYKACIHSYYFEVFERKNVPICKDFENDIYSDTEFKEIYPKTKDFGKWAWTFVSLSKALKKLNELNKQTGNSEN
jgi:hypothetical protein